MTDASHAQEILNLQTELATLRGEQATEEFGQAVMESVTQAKVVLEATAGDAEAFKGKHDEYVEALDTIKETLGETSAFIEEATKTSRQVPDGIEQFGEKSSEVAEVLGQIEGAMQRVQDMKELSEATATEQIRALSDLLGEVTGWLEDIIKLIPGLGAFIEVWRLGIESIAGSAAQLESIVLQRNRQAREADLPEPYTILKTGNAKRSSRIEEILDRLEQLGVDMDPPTQTSVGDEIPVDVRNAIKVGLRDSGMTYDDFAIKNAALQAARRRTIELSNKLSDIEGQILVGPSTGMSDGELAALTARAETVKGQLGGAVGHVEDLSTELQPVGDAVTGYLDRYVSGENADKWSEWARST